MEATAGADLDTTLASHWSKAITWPEYWPLICLEYTSSLTLAWHDIPALPGSLQMTAVVISWVLGDDEISTIVCRWFNGSWHMYDSFSLIWHDNYQSTLSVQPQQCFGWHDTMRPPASHKVSYVWLHTLHSGTPGWRVKTCWSGLI